MSTPTALMYNGLNDCNQVHAIPPHAPMGLQHTTFVVRTSCSGSSGIAAKIGVCVPQVDPTKSIRFDNVNSNSISASTYTDPNCSQGGTSQTLLTAGCQGDAQYAAYTAPNAIPSPNAPTLPATTAPNGLQATTANSNIFTIDQQAHPAQQPQTSNGTNARNTTTTPTALASTDSQSPSSLSTTAIAGIASGIIVLAAFIAFFAFNARSKKSLEDSAKTEALERGVARLNVLADDDDDSEIFGIDVSLPKQVAVEAGGDNSAHVRRPRQISLDPNDWTTDDASVFVAINGGGETGQIVVIAENINGRALLVLPLETIMNAIHFDDDSQKQRLELALLELRSQFSVSDALPMYIA
ncbi:UNVERIFIED_CONTAM: hypothetical protein HDU68_012090 [Siphonaria sp. JEL0065]|nr:hypothetical protein HDU68_012090 [Siphonaria sp. JEL0065]